MKRDEAKYTISRVMSQVKCSALLAVGEVFTEIQNAI
jgi:hypothetical protein